MPSFALERAQELLYFIDELRIEKAIPEMEIFLDSPMATKITKVFKKYTELVDDEMREFQRRYGSPFDFPGLTFVGSSEESRALNEKQGTFMIIAGSGMCTGGRIKHHLKNGISDPSNTLMFVGYQAVSTLGRLIFDGEKTSGYLANSTM